MNDVLADILNRGEAPTRTDIARLLASIGAPSDSREEKRNAVGELFAELGQSGNSRQGFSITHDLESYAEY